MSVLIITGARSISDADADRVRAVLAQHIDDASAVHVGDAAGVDAVAAELALDHARRVGSGHVCRHRADWQRHGKMAGSLRDEAMVQAAVQAAVNHVAACAPVPVRIVCLAFPGPESRGTESRGTWDCIRRAREAGADVVITPMEGA